MGKDSSMKNCEKNLGKKLVKAANRKDQILKHCHVLILSGPQVPTKADV